MSRTIKHLCAVSRVCRCMCGPAARSGARWWRGLDSNQRRRAPADLQSAPFSHSGTPPRDHAEAGRLSAAPALVNETPPQTGGHVPDPGQAAARGSIRPRHETSQFPRSRFRPAPAGRSVAGFPPQPRARPPRPRFPGRRFPGRRSNWRRFLGRRSHWRRSHWRRQARRWQTRRWQTRRKARRRQARRTAAPLRAEAAPAGRRLPAGHACGRTSGRPPRSPSRSPPRSPPRSPARCPPRRAA